jgi:hypothetical protein
MMRWLIRHARRLLYGWVVWMAIIWVVRVLAAPGQLTMRVTPRVGLAPLSITLDVHLVPEPDDRMIWLTSDPYISGSEIELDGQHSLRTHHRVWQVTEPGEYTVLAEVGHGRMRRASAMARISVQ